MDKTKRGIALFITLLVIASILSIVAVSFSYLEKVQKDAGKMSAIIQGNLFYKNTTDILKRFFPKGKADSKKLDMIYSMPLMLSEPKSGFSINLQCKPLIVAVPIKWLNESFTEKYPARLDLARDILSKIIEKYDIDLIHSHYAFPQGVLGAKLSKKYNIPNILTLHGSDVLKLSKNPVGKSFFNYAVNNTDKLICVSNFLKQELPATCQNKSTVIYNGVDFNLFNTNNNRDDNYAIFVGSFVPQKGLNLLVDVIKDIDYNFKFIGDGPLYNSIKNKIKNENLPNNFQGKLSDRSEASIPKSKICEFPVGNILSNIELLGRQNPQMVAQYIKNSSFLILPSISEGLGMTIIEAMACGKPVIGTKVGGIPELIKNNYNGFLIEPNNPDELKLRIKFLIDNTNGKKLRKELGTNGEIFSKSFDWKKTAKEVHKLYNSFK